MPRPGTTPITVVRSASRFATDEAGRSTRHSFSFGPHYDPDHLRFGVLVAHNDDAVAPGAGYPDHPHRDLEIVTWVLDGALEHRSAEGDGVVTRGRVQTMSAGSGVVHAETVPAEAGPTRFVQSWVLPRETGGRPAWAIGDVDPGEEPIPVASGVHPDAVGRIDADATLWVARAPGTRRWRLPEAPRLHVFVATGGVALEDGTALEAGDVARCVDAGGVLATASAGTELLVWEA